MFLHSLRRMAILSSEKFKGIKFDIKPGLMEISSSNPELGEAREELEIDYAGEPLTSRFNARYLIDVLSVLEETEVELLFKDELSPAIMRPADADGVSSRSSCRCGFRTGCMRLTFSGLENGLSSTSGLFIE